MGIALVAADNLMEKYGQPEFRLPYLNLLPGIRGLPD
jgi:hypothetical protein